MENRDSKSVKWSLKAIENGADIVRMHNVEAIKKVLISKYIDF
jgi:dihydropteroate synthase